MLFFLVGNMLTCSRKKSNVSSLRINKGMKNGINSIRNELQLNPNSCKQIIQSPMISTETE